MIIQIYSYLDIAANCYQMPDKIYKHGCGSECLKCWRNKLKYANPETKRYFKKHNVNGYCIREEIMHDDNNKLTINIDMTKHVSDIKKAITEQQKELNADYQYLFLNNLKLKDNHRIAKYNLINGCILRLVYKTDDVCQIYQVELNNCII